MECLHSRPLVGLGWELVRLPEVGLLNTNDFLMVEMYVTCHLPSISCFSWPFGSLKLEFAKILRANDGLCSHSCRDGPHLQ